MKAWLCAHGVHHLHRADDEPIGRETVRSYMTSGWWCREPYRRYRCLARCCWCEGRWWVESFFGPTLAFLSNSVPRDDDAATKEAV